MSEDRNKHLEFVQATITRMAGNSFLIRGWSVTLVAALFALAAKDTNPWFAGIAIFPCLMFWALDAFYLSQERKFRSLYDAVRAKPETDFSMDTRPAAQSRDGWGHCLISRTVAPFHGVILAVIFFVIITLIVASCFGNGGD